ncbi:hypothetical protein [Phenylobacterium montanum]|uniref:Lipoprotein n=1 Tax=Phenylobacterium montanum TaxID=2823693 RepID=A0A975G4D9_9CAUL|nr:hypothetical protein [Caulobacter sp. S6]QUD89816.1 hypothetical protein KCG34_08085 [Caulobacter sp. S6]
MKRIALLGAVATLAVGLSACKSGNPPAPPPPPPSPHAQFGAGFDTDFHVSSSAAPNPVKSGDVVPVDPTATPATNLH